MIDSLGIIGTGHLSAFVCEGLRASGWTHELLVSPYNQEKAEAFCQRFDARTADSNQDIIDRTKAVLIAVRPAQMKRALSGLIWPKNQILYFPFQLTPPMCSMTRNYNDIAGYHAPAYSALNRLCSQPTFIPLVRLYQRTPGY